MGSYTFRILLIDDNEHGSIARKSALEEVGYEVETAKGGSEGLKRFEEGGIDLVVTDYRMPDLAGTEVIRRIRRRRRYTPVVILSGFAERLGLTAESTGADAVLIKGPMEEKDLLRTVARLSKKRPQSEPGPDEEPSEGSGTIA